jgi:hypothetical protein
MVIFSCPSGHDTRWCPLGSHQAGGLLSLVAVASRDTTANSMRRATTSVGRQASRALSGSWAIGTGNASSSGKSDGDGRLTARWMLRGPGLGVPYSGVGVVPHGSSCPGTNTP